MIKYKIRDSDWLKFSLIIVNFNHIFIQPDPEEVGQAISELSRELSTNQIAPFSHRVLR